MRLGELANPVPEVTTGFAAVHQLLQLAFCDTGDRTCWAKLANAITAQQHHFYAPCVATIDKAFWKPSEWLRKG